MTSSDNCPPDQTPAAACSSSSTSSSLSRWFVQPLLPASTAADPDSWPPRNPSLYYDWSSPTHQVYRECCTSGDAGDSDTPPPPPSTTSSSSSSDVTGTSGIQSRTFSPAFSTARGRLDYSYHCNLVLNRQLLQDAIISRVLSTAKLENEEGNGAEQSSEDVPSPSASDAPTHRQKRQWIVFTAGAMGVGKGYVLTQLQQAGLLATDHFVKIDPDLIKTELPEMAGYLQSDRESAATYLHRESTQMADVLFEHALAHSLPILVDGSLRDVDYYQAVFDRIHREYADIYRIAILHVTADRDVILQRAASRAETTGRVVPIDVLEASLRQVPASVARLAPRADAVHVIANNENQPLKLEVSWVAKDGVPYGVAPPSWEAFVRSWRDDGERHAPIADIAPKAATGCTAPDLKCNMHWPKVRMADIFHCPVSRAAANDIWRTAYPNYCAGCSLVGDTQCGHCIHGRHLCACPTCNHGAGAAGKALQ